MKNFEKIKKSNNEKVILRYLEFYIVFPISIVVLVLGVSFFVDSISRGGVGYALAFIIFLIIIFAIKGMHRTMALYMDIFVDDDGIVRRLFNITLKKVRWSDIGVIRVSNDRHATYYSGYARSRKEKAYTLEVCSNKPSFDLVYFGKNMIMWSAGNPIAGGSFYKIKKAMNEYINRHSIRVESALDGVVSNVDHLP